VSVSGITSNNFYQSGGLQSWQTQIQNTRSEFQQLGQDLQAGNVTQAQQDFSTLMQDLPSGLRNISSLSQALGAEGQALQSGNLTDAQNAFATVQQDMQRIAHHHHHHHHGTGSLEQDFDALGQALQTGDLSSAQKAYATLQSDLQQMGRSSGSNYGSTTSQSTGSTVNLAA